MRGHARLQRHVARRGHAAQAGKKGQFLALRDRNGPPADRPERQAYRLRTRRRPPPGPRALAVAPLVLPRRADSVGRTEELTVGKEGVNTGCSRWWAVF